LYGYGSRQEMEDAKADFIFETVKDLENFFEADES
jgi:phosphoglycolate phosphatase-like HAD superfamily hydrolase